MNAILSQAFPDMPVPVNEIPTGAAAPGWTDAQYGARIHAHILHGFEQENTLYGEPVPGQNKGAPAIEYHQLEGKIHHPLVVAGACYEAQLYTPKGAQDIPIANRYLMEGAAGMLASTSPTITALKDGQTGTYALTLMGRFLEGVLHGQSLGAAFAAAHAAFPAPVGNVMLDNANICNMCEFVLYGDAGYVPYPAAAAEGT